MYEKVMCPYYTDGYCKFRNHCLKEHPEEDCRAPKKWERWERVPSQFEILAATFGQAAEIALKLSLHQPK